MHSRRSSRPSRSSSVVKNLRYQSLHYSAALSQLLLLLMMILIAPSDQASDAETHRVFIGARLPDFPELAGRLRPLLRLVR